MRLALILLAVACVYVYARHLTPDEQERMRQNGVLCTICTKLIDKITPYVKDSNITGIAHAICDDLTFGFDGADKMCYKLFDDSVGIIVADIQSGKTSQETCTDLKAC